jgi:hypothetical protein
MTENCTDENGDYGDNGFDDIKSLVHNVGEHILDFVVIAILWKHLILKTS